MSSNSAWRILQTAPIVRALRGRLADSGGRLASEIAISLLQVAELVLADLDLVAVRQPVRLDPAPVDVGAVEGAEVVDVAAVTPAHEEGVIAGDGDVVAKDPRVRAAADADPVLCDGEALPRAAASRADHEGGAGALDRLVDVDRLHLPGVVDRVGHGRRVVAPLGRG